MNRKLTDKLKEIREPPAHSVLSYMKSRDIFLFKYPQFLHFYSLQYHPSGKLYYFCNKVLPLIAVKGSIDLMD